MGERKGVNKYYPPDYDPTKGGLNKYHGTHALRERARKLHEGILIIRFEMPYNIWCNGCGNHIGMGVRYNAQKRKMGNYYTTPIYKFRMKCHLCDQHFEIQTDPKNCDYQILSGCRRKEERWDTEKAGNVQTTHREVKEKLMTNAMYKLEHAAGDQQSAKKVAPTLTRLEEIRDVWSDDFAVNRLLRKKFRDEKKEIQLEQIADGDVKERALLPTELTLVKETEEDKEKAKRMRFGNDSQTPEIQGKLRKRKIKESSIFGSSNDTKIELAKTLSRNPARKSAKNKQSNLHSNLTETVLGVKLRAHTECRTNNASNLDYPKESDKPRNSSDRTENKHANNLRINQKLDPSPVPLEVTRNTSVEQADVSEGVDKKPIGLVNPDDYPKDIDEIVQDANQKFGHNFHNLNILSVEIPKISDRGEVKSHDVTMGTEKQTHSVCETIRNDLLSAGRPSILRPNLNLSNEPRNNHDRSAFSTEVVDSPRVNTNLVGYNSPTNSDDGALAEPIVSKYLSQKSDIGLVNPDTDTHSMDILTVSKPGSVGNLVHYNSSSSSEEDS